MMKNWFKKPIPARLGLSFYLRIPMTQRFKKIALFSLPVSANSLINILGNIIGVIFIANLGIREIAAVNISASLYIALLTLTSTSTYATSILTGRELAKEAKGQPYSHARVFQSASIAVLLFTLPIACIMWFGSNLLELAGQSTSLTQLSKPYFHYAALTMFPLNLTMVNTQFCIGMKRPNVGFYFSLIKLALIVILSYGLIMGKLGLPGLGIAGITAAGFYGQSITCLLMYCYFVLDPDFKRLNLFKKMNLVNVNSLIQYYKLGIPIGLQFSGELVALFVYTMMIGLFGSGALAASQVANQYGLLLVMIFLGLSQTLSVFASINQEENHITDIKTDCLAAIALYTMFFTGLVLLFLMAYKPMISLYFNINLVENYGLLHLTLMLLAIRGFTVYVDGLRSLFSGVLRGLGNSGYPMKIGLYCLWFISIPCAYLTGFVFKGGIIGLCMGFSSGLVVATLLIWNRLNTSLNVTLSETGMTPKKDSQFQ